MTVDLAKLKELDATLEAAANRRLYRKLDFFAPYPKQKLFFDLGATKRERLLMAGNQQGKTEAGAGEAAYHATGLYPKDWKGRKFDHPTTGWVAGETSILVRNGPQTKLCGKYGVESAFGTGYIPRECFVDKPTLARGVTDAYDTIQVRHASGGISTVSFKSYEQGRTKFQGDTLDWLWWDEEPPIDIYSEGLARIAATQGLEWMTFTPLLGMSDVVRRFIQESSPDRGFVSMTIDDALHIPAEERQRIIDGYPAHERDARVKGIPMLGSGRVFPVSEAVIMEPTLEYVPTEWAKLWGIDFGIGHPFAAVLIAWDKDNDTIHVLHCIRLPDLLPIHHAKAMKVVGAAVPVAWPQDGTARDKGSGTPLASMYRTEGLMMCPEHATFPDGSMSTEAGIAEMEQRMMTARLRVAAHLAEWFEEFRMYHRKDGMIVKEHDDLMSATRIAVMARRFARPVQLGGDAKKRRTQAIANDVDFNLF